MMELIHMTATYSNAVLVAILPHVSDFSVKLDLPIPKVEASQVAKFNPSPYKERIEGAIWLTNAYWFHWDYRGFVDQFTSPRDPFTAVEELVATPSKFAGESTITTNEAIAIARQTLEKLGYPFTVTMADRQPEIQGPKTLDNGMHIPCCHIQWREAESEDGYSDVWVNVSTADKSIVGLYLGFAKTNKVGTPLTVDLKPETVEEFRERTKAKLYTRTNAPPRLSPSPGPAPKKQD